MGDSDKAKLIGSALSALPAAKVSGSWVEQHTLTTQDLSAAMQHHISTVSGTRRGVPARMYAHLV